MLTFTLSEQATTDDWKEIIIAFTRHAQRHNAHESIPYKHFHRNKFASKIPLEEENENANEMIVH